MCVRILIITTKRPLRHATETDVSVAKILGQSVTKRLDHNIVCDFLAVLKPDISALGTAFLSRDASLELGIEMVQSAKCTYLCGFVLVFIGMVCSYIRLQRCLVGSICLWENIYVTDRIKAPFSMGLLSPKIYLPYSLSEEYYVPVILHEKVHIARKDIWIKHFAVIILAVFWFQPVLWFAYYLFINDMETACDETVLHKNETTFREVYATALVEISYQAGKVQGAAIGYGNGEIADRIKNIMRYKKVGNFAKWCSAIVCIGYMLIAIMISWSVPRMIQLEEDDSVSKMSLSITESCLEDEIVSEGE